MAGEPLHRSVLVDGTVSGPCGGAADWERRTPTSTAQVSPSTDCSVCWSWLVSAYCSLRQKVLRKEWLENHCVELEEAGQSCVCELTRTQSPSQTYTSSFRYYAISLPCTSLNYTCIPLLCTQHKALLAAFEGLKAEYVKEETRLCKRLNTKILICCCCLCLSSYYTVFCFVTM